MSDEKKVVLAYPYVDADGKTHAADAEISLPTGVANDLVYFGRAREPKPKAAKADTPKEK